MAAEAVATPTSNHLPPQEAAVDGEALATYLGLSFALFLTSLPGARHLASLQLRGRVLATRLLSTEDQFRQLRASRREDARAAEIFAGHRAAWMEAERRLLARAAAASDEAAFLRAWLTEAEAEATALRARVEPLEREAAERDELLSALLAATRPGYADLRGSEEEPDGREAEQHPVAVPLDPTDTCGAETDAEALAAAAALYAQ